MHSRIRRGEASGPAEWLLAFLQARDEPPRGRLGVGVGPADWLLVFLDATAQVIRSGSAGDAYRSSEPETEAGNRPSYLRAYGA